MPAVVVCGKRSSSIFEELLLHTPPPASKRARCAAGASSPTAALRLSPSRTFPFADRGDGGSGGEGADLFAAHLAHLRSLFPEMDPQLLERVLEASGNDLDSAIKNLNDLNLGSTKISLDSSVSKSETGVETNAQLPMGGVINNNGVDEAASGLSAADGLPKDGSEWVELFVREMMNASDMEDARVCASRVLEILEKSITARASAEALQSFYKENVMLKEQFEVLLRENTILKRAVAIQHDRQKEYDEKSQELQHLRQLVSQYQDQLKTLEFNNYALAMHLREAQQSSSIPGRFNPDIF